MDSDERLIEVNSVFTKLLDKSEKTLIGTLFHDVLAPSDLVKLTGIRSIMEDGSFENIHMMFQCSNAEPLTLTVSGSTIEDESGELLATVLVAHDERELLHRTAQESRGAAQERKQAAELAKMHEELKETSQRELSRTQNLLVQSEKLSQLGQMIASIGHEIANPISLVVMSTSLVQDVRQDLETTFMPLFEGSRETVKMGEQFQEKLQEIQHCYESLTTASRRLTELSMALRTQSRMEQTATSGVDLNAVVHESLVLVGGRTKSHEVQKHFAELPWLTCNRSKIGQVVTNLLANAADALTDKYEQFQAEGGDRFRGKLSVTTASFERESIPGVLLRVSDNGNGVPDTLRDQIFDQFFTTKPAGAGTGLGLWMCAEIVKEHAGVLSVGRDDVLAGACFELWLPLG